MIIKKRNLLLLTLLVVIIMASSISGCARIERKYHSNSSETLALSVEELDYFNGDEFFNGEYMNIRNQFLSSLYDMPEDIDLFALFYCGSGYEEVITEAELEELLAYNNWMAEPVCPCIKIRRTNMDTVFKENTGLAFADTKGIGLEKFIYLENYDAYYTYHGDTNYRSKISFVNGVREGNVISLFYDDKFMGEGGKVLILKEEGAAYLFVSNEKMELPHF